MGGRRHPITPRRCNVCGEPIPRHNRTLERYERLVTCGRRECRNARPKPPDTTAIRIREILADYRGLPLTAADLADLTGLSTDGARTAAKRVKGIRTWQGEDNAIQYAIGGTE